MFWPFKRKPMKYVLEDKELNDFLTMAVYREYSEIVNATPGDMIRVSVKHNVDGKMTLTWWVEETK